MIWLVGCGEPEPPPPSADTGTEPMWPTCQESPCVRDLAVAQVEGAAGPGWFGQQLSVADDGEHGWVVVGAPQVPGSAGAGSSTLLGLPGLALEFRLDSEAVFDQAGQAVAAAAGAVSPIVATGAFFDLTAGPQTGSVYVTSSAPEPGGTLQSSATLIIHGDNTQFGTPWLGLDVEWLRLNDGVELVASAPSTYNAQTTGVPTGSAIYAFDPSLTGDVTAAAADRALRADESGLWAFGGWDADGDGIDDLVAEQAGVYVDSVVYRFPSPWTTDLTLADATTSWRFAPGNEAPNDVAGVGDVTGDGLPDLAMVAQLSSHVVTRAGGVFLVEGGDLSGGEAYDLPLNWLGTEIGEAVGSSVLGADMDGDGQTDLVVGAESVVPSPSPGKVAVFLGPLGPGALSIDDAAAVVHGEGPRDFFGISLAAADADRDGQMDLVIGASGWNGDQGKVYLVPGSALLP